MNVTIKGNIVTLGGFTAYGMLDEVEKRALTQFSVLRGEDSYFSISYAMQRKDHAEFADEIKEYNKSLDK